MLRLRTFAIVSVIAAAFTLSAGAEDITWEGPGGNPNADGNWNVGTNWSGGVVPVEGDKAILPAVTAYDGDVNAAVDTRTITVDSELIVGEVSVTPGSFKNLIKVDADMTVGFLRTGPDNVFGALHTEIASTATLTVANDNDQWYHIPVLTGSGTFVKAGASTLCISSAGLDDAWTGTIDIQKGQLWCSGDSHLGDPSMITVREGAALSCEYNTAGAWRMGDGLTLNGNGTSAFAGAFRYVSAADISTDATLSLATDSTIAVTNAAGIFTFTGEVSGPGKLTKIGDGKLVLGTGSLGGVEIAQGTLEIVGTLTSDINVAGGAELIVADGGQVIGKVTWFTAQGVGVSTPAVLTTGTVAVSITATGDTAGGFKVTQTPDVPAPESGWNPTGEFEYTIDGDTPDGQVTLYAWVMDSENVVTGPSTATFWYFAGTEISKDGMTATSSPTSAGTASDTIDNSPNDEFRWTDANWQNLEANLYWLRLDLGSPHYVDSFIYMGIPQGEGNHRVRDYKLYVTNVDSAVEGDWRTPVKTGTFANLPIPGVAAGQWGTPQLAQLGAPVVGRYVIFRPINTYEWRLWPEAAEVWVFGTPAPVVTTVESFTAADIDESKPDRATFTNGVLDVDIVATPGDDVTITGYQITINDNVPPNPDDTEGWETELTQFILPPFQAEGTISLYAWVRDSSGYVAGKPYTITYGVINSFTAADIDELKPDHTVLTNGVLAVDIVATPGHDVTITGYKITINDNVPPDPAAEGWETELTQLILPWDQAEGTVNLYAWVRESNGFIGVKTYTITYVVGQEIDKSGIVATSSPTSAGTASDTIDDSPNDEFRWTDVNWFYPEQNNHWLRLDLGNQHYVESFIYMGKPDGGDFGAHRVRDYKLYVTDVLSDEEADWGAPVITGTFANLPMPGVAPGQWGTLQFVKFEAPVLGQYVILRAINRYHLWPGAAEVWVYGTSKFWLIPGDANLDCKVNILDLLFVRNRLNQDVETGDNWQADFNMDEKINIVDLIFVRNHLNTSCPPE